MLVTYSDVMITYWLTGWLHFTHAVREGSQTTSEKLATNPTHTRSVCPPAYCLPSFCCFWALGAGCRLD